MADKKIQTTLVIRGDAKDSIRQLNLTGKELDALIGKQEKTISVSKRVAAGYGKVTEKLSRYALVGGGAVVAAGAAMVVSQLPVIDRLGKVSDRLDIATEKLVGYQHAASLGGVGNETFQKSFQTLLKNLGDAQQGFGEAKTSLNSLGLANEEFFNLKPDQQFELIADRIAGVSSAQERASIAAKLFGDSGIELLNTLVLGSEGMAELARQTEIAGTALTRIDAAKVEQANDALALAQMAGTGFAQQLTVKVAPALTDVANRVFDVVENVGGMGKVAENTFNYVITGLGFVGDAFRGVQIIVKTLEIGVAAISLAAIKSFGLIIEGYTNLANLIPGIDIDYEKTAFADLEVAVEQSFLKLNKDLQDLMLETIPSQKLDAYIQDVTMAAEQSAQAAIDSNTALNDSTGKVIDNTDELKKLYAELVGRYDPLQAASNRYNTELERLAKLQGVISDSDYATVLQGIEKAYKDSKKAIADAEKKTLDLKKQADPLAKSYEEAGKRIDASFAKAWTGAFKGFGELAVELKSSMRDLLGELAHQAITQPIIMQLGFANSAGGITAGSSISGASSIADVVQSLSLKGGNLGVSILSGINGLGGTSGIPGLDGILKGIEGSSSFVGPVRPATMASSVANFAKSLGAGIAGGFAGDALGEALFGKQANSSAGATIGGVLGSAGGPLGAFIGSALGSMIDVATGGDGKQRANAGFFVAPTPGAAGSDRTFGERSFSSGLNITGFARRADQAVAEEVIQTFGAVDETFSTIVRELGGVLDLSKKSLAALDQEARAGSSGTFFGLGGNGALDGDIPTQLKLYLDQLADNTEGLDLALLDSVRSAKTAEEALTVLSAALVEKAIKDQEQAQTIEKTERAEQELYDTRLENISSLVVSARNAQALQRSIRDQVYALQGIAVIGSGLTGSIDDQIAHINTLKEVAYSNHEQQLAAEQELFERRRTLTRSLSDYAVGLQLGSNSAISNADKLALARGQFRALAGRAFDESLSQADRLSAAESLQGAGDSYIEAGRANFASSAAYKEIFNEVLGVVKGAAGSIDPGGVFDPSAANAALIAELDGLQMQLAQINVSMSGRVVQELMGIRGSVDKLTPELATALAATMGEYMNRAMAAGQYKQVIADSIPRGSLAESAADKYRSDNGLPPLADDRSVRNEVYSAAEIAAYVDSVRANATSENDLIQQVYAAAKAGGVGSAQLAEATGLSQQDIIDAAVKAGLPSFAGGGIASGPTSGHLNLLHGNEAVIPLSSGSIPVRIEGGALVAEIRALGDRMERMNRELEQIRQLSYAAGSSSSTERKGITDVLKDIRDKRALAPIGGARYVKSA